MHMSTVVQQLTVCCKASDGLLHYNKYEELNDSAIAICYAVKLIMRYIAIVYTQRSSYEN